MNNSFQQDKNDTSEKDSILGKLKVLYGVINWLANLFQLSEEEQEDAGIFLNSEPAISYRT